ncbi:MAG TPA: uroporphyrinogen decarboxylase family protein, partial [Spirochaetia bacterium]|nr:uroporphyrinogen decarboxylase family protein [Spirochaetia bacterium]
YPQGDRGASPSGKMPKGGYYFDFITRQKPIVEGELDGRKWAEETFSPLTDRDLRFLEETSRACHENTEYALIGLYGAAAFGSITSIQAPHVKDPSGIRDIEEFWISYMIRPDYIKEIFSRQLEIQMENLRMFAEAVGNRIEVIQLSGTDFGSQDGPLISPEMYREFFKPLHKTVNRWVHENTGWKTFYHTCGSVRALIEDFIEAEIDILNPVQISARDMDPEVLKTEYGDRIVFWGGGVDTQRTLPFGTPDEVREEVERNMRIFGRGGGFVFSAVHNIQANVPVENLLAMFNAVNKGDGR